MSSKVEEREVRVIEVRMLHDGCGGEMKFAGMSKPSNPPYNLHICNKCGYRKWMHGASYPHIKYVPSTAKEF